MTTTNNTETTTWTNGRNDLTCTRLDADCYLIRNDLGRSTTESLAAWRSRAQVLLANGWTRVI